MLACLRMILAHRGIEVTEAALAGQFSLEEGGLDPDVLAELGRRYGLAAEARQIDLETVVALVHADQFPIVLVDRSLLDREFTIHSIVPVRFTRHYVIALDPLLGQRRIFLRKLDKAMKRVGGWAVVFSQRGA
jgi:ABC-type bacteriocin/lantibiotic exporter with double-glycine peptidase domain